MVCCWFFSRFFARPVGLFVGLLRSCPLCLAVALVGYCLWLVLWFFAGRLVARFTFGSHILVPLYMAAHFTLHFMTTLFSSFPSLVYWFAVLPPQFPVRLLCLVLTLVHYPDILHCRTLRQRCTFYPLPRSFWFLTLVHYLVTLIH